MVNRRVSFYLVAHSRKFTTIEDKLTTTNLISKRCWYCVM